jgi:ribose 5-phosphate isomerase B
MAEIVAGIRMTGLLVRHSATLWNEQRLWQGSEVDPPLSERGRLAATRYAEVVPSFVTAPGTLGVSSPMRRCTETSRLIRNRDVDRVLDDLIEIRSGRLAGRPILELQETEGDFVDAWFRGDLRTPPDGENIDLFSERVARGLDQLTSIRGDWFAVSHMGFIHSAVAQLDMEASEISNLGGLSFVDGHWERWEPSSIPNTPMRVGVASDHHGRPLEKSIVQWLHDRGFEVVPFPVADGEVDYPPIAIEVATAIRYGRLDRAVLICGTGIGMAIAANTVDGVRAATVSDPYSAERASASNDAQVLTFGAQVLGHQVAPLLLEAWIGASLDSARSVRKVTQIAEYEAGGRGGQR